MGVCFPEGTLSLVQRETSRKMFWGTARQCHCFQLPSTARVPTRSSVVHCNRSCLNLICRTSPVRPGSGAHTQVLEAICLDACPRRPAMACQAGRLGHASQGAEVDAAWISRGLKKASSQMPQVVPAMFRFSALCFKDLRRCLFLFGYIVLVGVLCIKLAFVGGRPKRHSSIHGRVVH